MLLKTVGCILIVVSSTTIGLNYINNLKSRVTALNEISEFMSLIKIKMEYELCDIPNILNSLSDKHFVAQRCFMHIKSGSSLKSAWHKSADEYAEKLHLKQEDKRLLNDFCACFGQTDIDGQISNFNMYSELIEKNLNEAKAELANKSKVILSTSIFAGILITILLI